MPTIGWLFILIAAIVAQRVSKGRALYITEDLSKAFQALINGNYDDLSAVLSQTGDSTSTTAGTNTGSTGETDGVLGTVQQSTNGNVAYWAYQLGKAAKGYRWAAAGPDYYDCSGLMYRAVQKVGYTGPRFFTGNVASMPGMKKLASTGMGISQVTTGDLVVWPGHHMGVVVGNNRFYSALNPRSGIGERNIEGFRKGESPIYLRFTGGGK